MGTRPRSPGIRLIAVSVITYYRNSQGDTPFIRPSTPIAARRASMTFPREDYHFQTASVTAERAATVAA